MDISRLPTDARERRRTEIRDFLRSRRARVTPESAGMPGGGGRRTPGLRREEVAVLAGVGVSWYTWLEQGREINVSADVLDAVARVLRLDDAERAHLYVLSGLNPPPPAPTRGEVPPPLRRVVHGWTPPAYVIDRHWNLVVVNRAAREAFGYREADDNCLVGFFTGAHFRSAARGRDDAARAIVGRFRADAARHPDDPEFARLAADLCATSPAFAREWARMPIGGAARGVKSVVHPTAGELVFETSTLLPPDLPDHRLLLYTPAPGTDTETRLADLLAATESVPAAR
jgi:transcriptional regulator with XRE-family HTH domain